MSIGPVHAGPVCSGSPVGRPRSSARISALVAALALVAAPAVVRAEAAPAPREAAPGRSTTPQAPTQTDDTPDAAPASDSPDGEPIRLDTVEVIGDAEDDPPPEPTVREDPTGFGTVIEREEFDGVHLGAADLLLHAPGTRVHRAPGGATLMLRGTSSDQSLVFLDGIQLNPASGGGVDLRTIPTGLLERITVLRGNEGALYGAGALGGVALLETRQPDGAGLDGSLVLTGGSFATYGFDGTISGGDDDLDGLASISLLSDAGDYAAVHDPTPNFQNGDETDCVLANNDARFGALLLKGRARLGEGADLHGLVQGSLGERGIPGTCYAPDNHRRDERRVLAALRAVGGADLRLEGGVEFRHDEVAVWDPSGVRSIASQPLTDESGKPWQIENGVTLRSSAESAPAAWTLLRVDGAVGMDWLSSPYHDSLSRERLSAGIRDELYVGSSVTVAPALRFDRVGEADGLSPKLGVAWRPWAPLEIRASVGRTFRAPTLGELYLEQALVKANPDLVPEKGWTADGGVVLRGRNAHLELSAFYSRIEDLIVYEIVSGSISKPFNFQDAAIRGGEIAGGWSPLPWLAARASYALARTVNLRDDPRFLGNEIPYRPAHRAQARVALRQEDAETFVEGSYEAPQFRNRANTLDLPEQLSFRTGAGYRVARAPWSLWLSGQVDNVFDAGLSDQLGFAQPGRAFYVTLRAAPAGDGA